MCCRFRQLPAWDRFSLAVGHELLINVPDAASVITYVLIRCRYFEDVKGIKIRILKTKQSPFLQAASIQEVAGCPRPRNWT